MQINVYLLFLAIFLLHRAVATHISGSMSGEANICQVLENFQTPIKILTFMSIYALTCIIFLSFMIARDKPKKGGCNKLISACWTPKLEINTDTKISKRPTYDQTYVRT